MKKFIIVAILLITLGIAGYFALIFFHVSPLAYSWSICENGYYSKYPKGILDSNATYYDSSGTIVGSCGFWTNQTPECRAVNQKAGQCTEVSYWKFLSQKK